MKKTNILNVAIFITILVTIILGCKPNRAVTSTDEMLWSTFHGEFMTNNQVRAQEEIPFTIVYPTYIPKMTNTTRVRLPEISGPLKEVQNVDHIEIQITYVIDLTQNTSGQILIYEDNYSVTAPDPALNPDEKYIEIHGKQLVMETGSNEGSQYWFNQNEIYYSVGFINITSDKAYKVVESMIK